MLTHWGQALHICISKLMSTGSDNGLSPWWHQAITWANAVILLIVPLGTKFSEILVEIVAFSFKKNAFESVVCKMAAMLSQPQSVNVETTHPGWQQQSHRSSGQVPWMGCYWVLGNKGILQQLITALSIIMFCHCWYTNCQGFWGAKIKLTIYVYMLCLL